MQDDLGSKEIGRLLVLGIEGLIDDRLDKRLRERVGLESVQGGDSSLESVRGGDSSGAQFSILDAFRADLEDKITSKKESILKNVGTRGAKRALAEMLLDAPSGVERDKLVQRYLKEQRGKRDASEKEALASAQEMLKRVVEVLIKSTRIDL